MISVAWTPLALQQLQNFFLTPQGITQVQNHVQNWVLGGAAAWALNSNHNMIDITTGATVTAHVAAVNGADRTVNIISIV